LLAGLVPRSARRLGEDGREEDAVVGVLAPGDRVRVWIGEAAPADGVVVEGRSTLDESKITGAREPRTVGPGDLVLAGAVNREGAPLLVRVERESGDGLLSRLVRILKSALGSHASMERVAEKFGARVVGLGLLVAAATFAYWTWRGSDPRYSLGLLNAAAVLVAIAPGALALAVRRPVAVGIVHGARSGVVFRDAATLEKLRDADTLVALLTRPIEEDDLGTLRALRASGLRVLLWIGDGVAVPSLPEETGIEITPAPSSPEAGAAELASLGARKRIVAIAAGADHAEAMPAADVRIVFLSGFEEIPAAAGVTLVRGDLRSILRARRLARAVVANQKQGLLLVFAYTALAVPVAAGALVPYLGFLLDPMVAAGASAWCTLMVLAGALRVRWEEL
jgi:cation transport ATPase